MCWTKLGFPRYGPHYEQLYLVYLPGLQPDNRAILVVCTGMKVDIDGFDAGCGCYSCGTQS